MSASESEITFLVLQHQLHLNNSKSVFNKLARHIYKHVTVPDQRQVIPPRLGPERVRSDQQALQGTTTRRYD